jgi:hypothetical protein
MNNLPDFDSWLYAQAEAHMQRCISDDEDDNEHNQDAIIEHEIQRILDIQAELNHD